MKIKTLLLTLALVFSATVTLAETQTQFFSFTKTKGTVDAYVKGQELMNTYLVGNADNFISEIECELVRTRTWGIVLGTIWKLEEGKFPTNSIKIFFNPDKLMKVKSITFYVNSYEYKEKDNNPGLKFYLNGELVDMPTLPYQKECTTSTPSTLLENTIKNNQFSTAWVSPNLNSVPMQELELKSTFIDSHNDVQVLGFSVEYDGTTKDIDTGVAELEAESNAVVEYYDMMGRMLPAAPAKGLYIEKVGTKATKRYAN